MQYRVLSFLLLCQAASAAMVDQIAITVGGHVITESQIDEEIRVTALLNQTPAEDSLQQRRAAASRLIDQTLMNNEIELTHYPGPDQATVEEALQRVQALYGSAEAFAQILRLSGLDYDDVRQHLTAQIATVRFVAFRFRPDAGISDADIDAYYKRRIGDGKQSAKPPVPETAASRANIRRALIEERTDEALDDWLGQARKQSRIVFLDKSLGQTAQR